MIKLKEKKNDQVEKKKKQNNDKRVNKNYKN